MAIKNTFIVLVLASLVLINSTAGTSDQKKAISTPPPAAVGVGVNDVKLTDQQSSINNGGLDECRAALIKLQSCSSNLVQVFMTGRTHISEDCCRKFSRLIESCRPAINSLGFSVQEASTLRSYCSAAVPAPAPAPSYSSAYVPAPVPRYSPAYVPAPSPADTDPVASAPPADPDSASDSDSGLGDHAGSRFPREPFWPFG